MNSIKDYIDIRNVLKFANYFVFALSIIAYQNSDQNNFINGTSVFLTGVLALVTHIGLYNSRRDPDPFVIILLYYVIVYYTLRIGTIAYFEHSDVFHRFKYSADDTNYALCFIILANAFLLAGLRMAGRVAPLPKICEQKYGLIRFIRITLFLLFFLVVADFFNVFEKFSEHSQIAGVFIFLIKPTSWFYLIAAFLVAYNCAVPKKYIFFYILIYSIFAVKLTYTGTKGVLVTMAEFFALLLLCSEYFRIKKRSLYIACASLILLIVPMISIYNFATLQRASEKSDVTTVVESFDNNFSLTTTVSDYDRAKPVLAHIFSRVGFLDMSAEIISHTDNYGEIFTLQYYLKSIADNILSPGFDFFDTPKVSYALIFKHEGYNLTVPSKLFLSDNNIYHSDQLTLYGEVYALFGWGSLLLLYLFAFYYKKIYCNFLISYNRCHEVVRRMILLVFFVQIINSFGFDWAIVQILPLLFNTYIFFAIFNRVVVATDFRKAKICNDPLKSCSGHNSERKLT